VTATGFISALLGIVLFAWYVRRVGPADIWQGLREIGWGLILIVLIAGVRFALRALAWRACLEPPHRLPFRDAFLAVVSGDAFGNLTPLGPIVGEPAKAAFVRGQVALAPALTALAVENLFYTMSVAVMIAASMIALLLRFDLPEALREASEVAVAAIVIILGVAFWILLRRPAVISRALGAVLPAGSSLQSRLEGFGDMEREIYTFASRRPAALARVSCAEIGFHALGVLEIHITWWLMLGAPPALLTSFVLEGANRLITVVFKFVPLRLGVDEFTTAQFTTLLGFGPTPGTTLAIARKIRVLFWTTLGTALLVRRGLR
jgi:lysylphosphatidylglycerol synthase-like protein